MEIVASLFYGFEVALRPENLLYCFIGVFLGTFVGVLPGIGATATIAVLLPVTYALDPTTSFIMLAGVYYGAEYGGSTASILLNIPGTPSNAITCLDGYPLTQQGRGGVALFTTAITSFMGGTAGILALIIVAPIIVSISRAFGPAEYVAVILFGLIASAAVSQARPAKGLTMVALGLMLGTVGIDVNTGTYRFSFNYPPLIDGISLVALAMGIFGVSEVINSIRTSNESGTIGKITFRSMLPNRSDLSAFFGPVIRGSGIGMLMGTLPGTGPTIASFISYAMEKRVAKDKSRFGRGALEGIAGPEASNNAAAQTAFIPTLTLGIPGTATMAIMLGALMIHGITPGPGLMRDQPELFWGLVASFAIGNLMLLVLNIPMIGLWVRLLSVPFKLLYPTIICLICLGVFSVRNSAFDVVLTMALGVVGYFMRAAGFPLAPLLIGFILGPILEENLRRALLLSRGDMAVFIESPLSLAFLLVSLLMVVLSVVGFFRRPR
ncbi:tripartite tricarboxylate transporter permease [Devosia sp. YIM 151766]|uniref:tripartite tricarboxylate transporter permease n=1 Tax=Devosia sp. YIM 151766 TaxID=3017325 RepID=UPI00255CDD4A|nr:tripartite tricarboxylate transporter permease [Devosia sp. YIM 151766]WIY53179.1 tripartite tricarboxylate transporter permease [Devosia sp. YIM 151766]